LKKKSLLDRLYVNQQTTVLFTYSLLASVLVIFTKQDFSTAALIAGGSMILPIFEELYFRALLLGSISYNWPSVNSMAKQERAKVLKEGAIYLILTSLGFTLVHDDVIQKILSGSYTVNYAIILLRFLFGSIIGGLYYYTRNFIVTSTFHIIYNLTYIISRARETCTSFPKFLNEFLTVWPIKHTRYLSTNKLIKAVLI